MKTICCYCGKTIHKSPRQYERHKKHFCNTEHYYKYRSDNPVISNTKDTVTLKKIKEFAKKRNELLLNKTKTI